MDRAGGEGTRGSRVGGSRSGSHALSWPSPPPGSQQAPKCWVTGRSLPSTRATGGQEGDHAGPMGRDTPPTCKWAHVRTHARAHTHTTQTFTHTPGHTLACTKAWTPSRLRSPSPTPGHTWGHPASRPPSPKPQAWRRPCPAAWETHVVSVSGRAGISVPDSGALPGPQPHWSPPEGPPQPRLAIPGTLSPSALEDPTVPTRRHPSPGARLGTHSAGTGCAQPVSTAARLPAACPPDRKSVV